MARRRAVTGINEDRGNSCFTSDNDITAFSMHSDHKSAAALEATDSAALRAAASRASTDMLSFQAVFKANRSRAARFRMTAQHQQFPGAKVDQVLGNNRGRIVIFGVCAEATTKRCKKFKKSPRGECQSMLRIASSWRKKPVSYRPEENVTLPSLALKFELRQQQLCETVQLM
jgi:hypothetical protein